MPSFRRALARLCSVVLATVLASFVLVPVAASAADFEAAIRISQTSPTPQDSGKDFVYALDVNCDSLSPDPEAGTSCTDLVLTVPLDGLADRFGDAALADMIELQNLPAGATHRVVGGELRISVGDVEAGDSARYQLIITPPNLITPNGTQWTLDPELSGGNVESSSAPQAVTSRANARLDHNIAKTLRGTAFRTPGELVTYDLVVSCTRQSTGMIRAATMTVDDTLPAGLTFVSSVPAPANGTVLTKNHTWNVAPPASCTTNDTNGTATIAVTARLDADLRTGTALVNRAGITSTTIDGQNVARKTATASVTVINDGAPGPGTFGKRSFGQLRDRDAAPSTANSGQELESHTTYKGNWLGYRTDQPANVLDNNRPNQNTSMRQSGYILEHNSGTTQGAGWSVDVVDPVPCRDGESDTDDDKLYESKAPSSPTPTAGQLCQSPAFHVKTVSVYSSDTGVDATFDSAAYAPRVVYSDGTSASMVRIGATSGGREGNYRVPTLTRTDVAEIRFPRNPALSGQNLRWAVFGHTDAAVETDSIVRNTARAAVFWEDATEPSYTRTDSADLYVIDNPQIGIEKDLGNHAASYETSLRLTARLLSSSEASQDLVVTDLLPEGMRVKAAPAPTNAVVAHAAANGTTTTTNVAVPASAIEVIDNFRATGRQLVRATVPAADLAPFGAFKAELVLNATVTYGRDPGPLSNTAQVFYTADPLLPTCQQSPAYEQGSGEPADVNDNGRSDRFCYAQDSLTVPPPSGGANFKVTKTVQGDRDVAPKSYPGVGVISKEGGTAAFGVTWRNTGASPLERSVVYDIFPRVGDMGVGGSVAGRPRNSAFDAVLTSVTNPSDVTIEYTTATNPCRPEVFPNAENPGCVEYAWTATAPTTDAERVAVTGVRLSKTGPFAPGAGWGVDIHMTVPRTVTDDEIAWNSVAGAAKVVGGSQLNPNSPPKVGISANENQALQVSKVLQDAPTAVRPGGQLTYRLGVVNPNVTAKTFSGAYDQLPEGLDFVGISPAGPTYSAETHRITWPDDVSMISGQTREWTVTTRVAAGTSGDLRNYFTVPGGTSTENVCEDDPEAECASVDVESGTLTIDKTMTGGAVDWAELPLTLDVDCAVGTDPVTLPGGGALTLDADDFDEDGTASTSLAVPFGSVCTVTEPGDGGATEDPTITPATVTIAADDADGEFQVDVTNTYEAGGLRVRKDVAGVGAGFNGGTFTFDVDCTYGPDPERDAQTVLSVDGLEVEVAADATSGQSGVLADDLPIGSVCTVTETDAAGADETADPVEVTIVRDAETSNVTTALVTNAYSAGSVAVAKTLEGAWADTGALDEVDFTVLVRCQLATDEGEPADLWSGQVQVAGGESTTVMAGDAPRLFPVGTVCFAPEETEDHGATRVDIEQDSFESGVEVTAGSPSSVQELTIDVTNTFEAGSLTVLKEAVGVGAELSAGTYRFGVLCTFEGETVLERHDVDVELLEGETTGAAGSLGPLPVGASCDVAETDTGSADVLPDPQTVVVVEDEDDNAAMVTFENGFSAGFLVLAKELVGRYADHGLVVDREFTLDVTCVDPRDTDGPALVEEQVTIRGGDRLVLSDDLGEPVLLPAGTGCWATESDDGGADLAEVDHDSPESAITVQPAQLEVLQDLTVTATNTFSTDPDPAEGDAGAGLPGAGGPAGWLALLGAALLALGAGFLARRRRLA